MSKKRVLDLKTARSSKILESQFLIRCPSSYRIRQPGFSRIPLSTYDEDMIPINVGKLKVLLGNHLECRTDNRKLLIGLAVDTTLLVLQVRLIFEEVIVNPLALILAAVVFDDRHSRRPLLGLGDPVIQRAQGAHD